MKILYFDCFSGISGDMTIGALLDLGIDREVFLKILSRLKLEGYEIEINKKTVNGISGTDVNVMLKENGHEHVHHHSHDHTHAHGERGLADIELILDRSSLSENAKDFSKKVFREIAAAEAKVHGKSIDEVHFHEVGAVDSIVDVAGTAICLDLLGVDRVYSSALHDGSGFIECRHGIIPVPVPAVLEMLKGSGIPMISENVSTELVTPTGMGLIKCLAASFGSRPPMLVEKTGYGFGKRDTGRLNALRVILGETYEEQQVDDLQQRGKDKAAVLSSQHDVNIAGSGEDEIVVLETNIDDTTAEILGYTMSKLLEAGALDAFYTPVFMKKNRPAYMLTVLAAPGHEDAMADIILRETSTLGIRTRSMKRYCMEREIVTVDTPYGEARVKIATRGGLQKASLEYEDCRKIAESAGLPLAKVYFLMMEAAKEKYGL